MRGAGLGLLLVFLLAACSGASSPEPAFIQRGATMGTTFTVKASSLPAEADEAGLKAAITAALADVNNKMSTYIEDSELSRFNRYAGNDWFPVSGELVAVVKEAQALSQVTDGAYDISVGPLVNLWGFGPELKMPDPPADDKIQAALGSIGHQRYRVRDNPPALQKDVPGLYLDLSSLAKGHGVDRVAEVLEKAGITDYLVEIGGEIRVKGHNPKGQTWRIAIEKPLVDQRAVQEVVAIPDGAIATSGDYRNYFESDGVRYSHTIDPRTGQPIDHRLASVSVFSHTSRYADAVATALMVLGPEQGFELAQKQQWAAFFIIKGEAENFVEKRTTTFPPFK